MKGNACTRLWTLSLLVLYKSRTKVVFFVPSSTYLIFSWQGKPNYYYSFALCLFHPINNWSCQLTSIVVFVLWNSILVSLPFYFYFCIKTKSWIDANTDSSFMPQAVHLIISQFLSLLCVALWLWYKSLVRQV